MGAWLIPMTIVTPFAGAMAVAFIKPLRRSLRALHIAVGAFVLATALLALVTSLQEEAETVLFEFLPNVPLYFRADSVAVTFALLTVCMWLSSTVFSFEYLAHGEREDRYNIFSLLALAALMGVCFSGNLVTTYLFYEMMTLATFPLVMHEQTKEAISAGMTYLYYSLAGAFLGLVGIFFLYAYSTPGSRGAGGRLMYRAGGFLSQALTESQSSALLVAVFLMLVGLGSKAGMFPLHGWLPKAHPVAPAPASALLSGNITKMGILFIIRIVYYCVGPRFIGGTWAQYALLTLTVLTIFLGSMLAFREKVMKKRLAYSTVSQTSYILAGIYILADPTGSFLHVIFHSVIKNLLFLCAGAVIVKTGKTKVAEWKGLGRQMPFTMTAFTIGGLALVGIPPLAGFVSKWHIATTALGSGTPYFSIIVPVILLVSALLTAGYLMGPAADAWFVAKAPEHAEAKEAAEVSGAEVAEVSEVAADVVEATEEKKENAPAPETTATTSKREAGLRILIPLGILAAAAIVFGLFPNPLVEFFEGFYLPSYWPM